MNAYSGSSGGVPSMPEGFALTLEVIVAVMVTLAVVISSLLTLKERHRDAAAWHVHVGALIYGAVFGVVIGFIIVPLRMLLSSGNVDPRTAGWSSLVFVAVMIALRRGLIGRLPFLGPQVKAYRRAALRRSIEMSQKQLARLAPRTAPPAPAPVQGGAS